MKTEFDNTENEALNKTDVNHSVLTLEDLVSYLPYSINGFYMDADYDKVIEVEGLYNHEDIYNSEHGDLPIQYFKPILRPITSVFKKINVNGEVFRPSVKLNFYLAFSSDKEFYDDVKKEIISAKLQRQLIFRKSRPMRQQLVPANRDRWRCE